MTKKILIISLLVIGSSLVFAGSASAQKADLNIGISPPITHVVIQPGKSAITTVAIENQGHLDMNITPNFVDFKSDNKSGIPVLGDSMSFPYISLQDETLHLNTPSLLKSGVKKQIVFEIAMPENSLEKEYHFSLVFNAEPIQNSLTDSNQTQVAGQIVTNFIVTVSESAQDEGVIKMQSFEAPLFVDSLNAITVNAFMENVGKNTTVTLGDLRITNLLGKAVYDKEILPENILPGSARQIFGAETTSQDGEEFKTPVPFKYRGLFLIGPYKIALTYHSPGQEPETFEHTVFALPISLLILGVVIYIVYLLYTKTKLFQGRRSVHHRENHDQE